MSELRLKVEILSPPTEDSTNPSTAPGKTPGVIDSKDLMIAIGVIGIALPFVLALGTAVLRWVAPASAGFAYSISGYYYTGMRNVFVGSLCAIGVFLGAYCGYERKDRIAGNFACVFAIGVALFPTSPDPNFDDPRQFIGIAHYLFAASLFVTLAYFCLCLFTMTHPTGSPEPDEPLTPEKKKENAVYRASGWTIIACIALIVICEGLFLNDWSPMKSDLVKGLYPVYWLEAVAVVSFGISWLTKSKSVFGENK